MSVSIAAAWHHEPFACIVNNFSLSCFDESFRAFPVADIDVLAILHRECFDELIAFGRENLPVNNEVSERSVSLSC